MNVYVTGTVMTITYIICSIYCAMFPMTNRRHGVTWSHICVVAYLYTY